MRLYDAHSHIPKNKNRTFICSNFLENKNTTNNFVGIHPWDTENLNPTDLKEFMKNNKTKFEYQIEKNNKNIGEIGLDKFRGNFEIQKEILSWQIDLAKKYNRAITIHCVKSFQELFPFIKDYNQAAILHSFNSSKEILKQFSINKVYFSFSYKNLKSPKTIEALKNCPLNRLLLESDATTKKDLKNLKLTYKQVAKILNIPIHTLKKIVKKNFLEIARTSKKR